MCLGSIAHLQYYFARTGLLEGRGGQVAKTKENGELDIPRLSLGGSDVIQSPIEEEGQMLWEAAQEEGEEVLLPPTVSTYSQPDRTVAPPPDQKTLKKDLVNALENALQALESCDEKDSDNLEVPTQGFYEIQGLHVLDTTTLAIRAARLYYTLHANAFRLNQIKSDIQIRRELYAVLEVLKKCAGRNFAGGIREDERLAILVWVSDVGMMIDQEARLEEQERREREDWHWMDDSIWAGRDQDREMSFMRFLRQESDSNNAPLSADTSRSRSSTATTPNLSSLIKDLADGRQLVQMHNAAVDKSKKRFGHIGSFHADIVKPYRRADNVRYWLKASELRWEMKLNLDVTAVVNAKHDGDEAVWKAFEEVVLQWCRHVLGEITRDWRAEDGGAGGKIHARAKSMASSTLAGSPASSPRRERKGANVGVTVVEES